MSWQHFKDQMNNWRNSKNTNCISFLGDQKGVSATIKKISETDFENIGKLMSFTVDWFFFHRLHFLAIIEQKRDWPWMC